MRSLKLGRHELWGLERMAYFIAPPVAAIYAVVAIPRHLWSAEHGLIHGATWRPLCIGVADDLRDYVSRHRREPCWRTNVREDEYVCLAFLPANPTGIRAADAFARRAVDRQLLAARLPSCSLGEPP